MLVKMGETAGSSHFSRQALRVTIAGISLWIAALRNPGKARHKPVKMIA